MKSRRVAWSSAVVVLVLGAICLTGCAQAPWKTAPAATPAPLPSLTATPTPLPTFTPVVQALSTAAAPTATTPPLPTPAPRPFDVVFPTAGPTPETPWRPPMYPVPWAPTAHDHFFLTRPIPAFYGALPVVDYRYGGVFFENEVHTGMDIPGDLGTPVLATGDGQVIWAGYGLESGRPGVEGPYGLAVMIRHNFGWQGRTVYTIYAHLSEIDVRPGWWVKAGTPLGRMGNTGHTTGSHLHFEVRLGIPGKQGEVTYETRNPELWLVPPMGWGVIVGRVLDSWGRPLSHNIVYLTSLDDENFRWRTYTYAHHALIHGDDFYRENYAFGDLPAGRYRITVVFHNRFFAKELEVLPGRVTFFQFNGWSGFEKDEEDKEDAQP